MSEAASVLTFAYESAAVRIVMIDDSPWWVASDLASILGYQHVPHMVRMLDDDQKGVHLVDTLGGAQRMAVVPEGGMYRCVMRSKRPEAKAFCRWIENVLLPTLRRTGRFELAPCEPATENEQSADQSPLLNNPMFSSPLAIQAYRAVLDAGRRAGALRGNRAEEAFLVEHGILRARELPSGRSEVAQHMLASINASVADWMAERVVALPGHRERSMALYDDYVGFCHEQSYDAVAVVNLIGFGKALSNCGVPTIKSNGMWRVGLKLAANALAVAA